MIGSDAQPAARVAVIVLTVDQREKTLRCLESLRQVGSPPFKILLWDNGSRDGTAEAVRERFPEVLVHHHGENLGVASGRNAAAELAIRTFQTPFLLFIDNDMEGTAGLLSALIQPFEEDERLAQTTGKIALLEDQRRLYGAGGCYVSFWSGRTGHVGHGELDRGQYDEPRRCLPSGGCMLVRADLFRRFGGFDTAFDPYGPEDLDFGLRLRRAGYYALYVPEARVLHESQPGHTSVGGMRSESYVRNKTRLWLVLMRRHATLGQKLAFALIGVPWGILRVLFREIGRGNLRAIRALASGLLDHVRSVGRPRHRE